MDGSVRVRSLVWFATGVVVSLMATVIVLQTWRVDAAPGDEDSTLVPMTPCRLVDTRATGNPLGAGEVRTVESHGTNGPIPGSQCSIPTDSVGLSMNVTAVDATAPTYWTIWPDGEPQPEVSSLNPAPGQPPTPNAVITPTTAGRFQVYNDAGTVEMIVDVNGYYTKASLQELASRVAANEADIEANGNNVALLSAAQPFTVASDPIDQVTAQTALTAIRSVTVTAPPVAGHVAVIASGDMDEASDVETVECGLMDSVADPPAGVQLFWQSPVGGDRSHLSASRVFDIAADATATYYLVCRNTSSGDSIIRSPQVTAIFTAAP